MYFPNVMYNDLRGELKFSDPAANCLISRNIAFM